MDILTMAGVYYFCSDIEIKYGADAIKYPEKAKELLEQALAIKKYYEGSDYRKYAMHTAVGSFAPDLLRELALEGVVLIGMIEAYKAL